MGARGGLGFAKRAGQGLVIGIITDSKGLP
jgi:hypothetical protein